MTKKKSTAATVDTTIVDIVGDTVDTNTNSPTDTTEDTNMNMNTDLTLSADTSASAVDAVTAPEFDLSAFIDSAKLRLQTIQDSIREDAQNYQQLEIEVKEKQEEISALRKKMEEINVRTQGPRAEMAKLNAIISPAVATGRPNKTTRGSLPVWLKDLPAVFTAADVETKYGISRAVINQTLSTLSKPEDGRVIRQERGKYTLA